MEEIIRYLGVGIGIGFLAMGLVWLASLSQERKGK